VIFVTLATAIGSSLNLTAELHVPPSTQTC
jgi:hypothetical protein